MTFRGGHYYKKIWRYRSVEQDWKLHFYNRIPISLGANELKCRLLISSILFRSHYIDISHIVHDVVTRDHAQWGGLCIFASNVYITSDFVHIRLARYRYIGKWQVLRAAGLTFCNFDDAIITSPIARFMGPAWSPSGADRTQVGPMLAPWTLISRIIYRQTLYAVMWFGSSGLF